MNRLKEMRNYIRVHIPAEEPGKISYPFFQWR